MKQINFKNFDGHFYVEEFNNGNGGEEYGRAKIYDENMQYLDYVLTEWRTESEYNAEVEDMANCEDYYSFFEIFCQSYDYGEEPKEIMDTYCDDIACGNGMEETQEERDLIKKDIDTMTDKELCKEYDINKIGTMYFRGNW